MADYKRLVSYIYAYPGGVRDKNVGFAKAEVRNGQFKLTVSVKGVYTDTPELFGVYVMVDGKKHQPVYPAKNRNSHGQSGNRTVSGFIQSNEYQSIGLYI